MRKIALPILGTMLGVFIAATPANAQATRTWVSGVGDDANPCSRTAPCKTFPGAISKTAAGGEINCLDSGGFGAVTITKSISIVCNGVIGGLVAASSNGVIVNAGVNDNVVLKGLDIDGLGSGFAGVRFLAGGTLTVQDTVIRNFRSGNAVGIEFLPSGAAELQVSNTAISSSTTGIIVQPSATGSAKVILSNVQVNNGTTGIRFQSSSAAGAINGTITNSVIAGNSLNGLAVNVGAVGFAGVQVMVDQTSIVNNANAGLRGDGNGSITRISQVNVTGNGLGSQLTGGAVVQSYSNNHIDGNTDNGPNPATIPNK
jgi:hypothetical protein